MSLLQENSDAVLLKASMAILAECEGDLLMQEVSQVWADGQLLGSAGSQAWWQRGAVQRGGEAEAFGLPPSCTAFCFLASKALRGAAGLGHLTFTLRTRSLGVPFACIPSPHIERILKSF